MSNHCSLPSPQPYAHEFVCQAAAYALVARNLRQFLFKKLIATSPINFRINLRKEKGDEFGEVAIEDVLPCAILRMSWG